MKMFKAISILFAFIFTCQISLAETVVLQNGTNGYNGCTDSWIIMDVTTNNGDLTVIKVKGGWASCVKYRGVLKFDLDGLPENVAIDSAVLSMYCYRDSVTAGAVPFSVYKLLQNWDEAGVTWFKTGMTATETWQSVGGKYNTTKLATITPSSNQANKWVNLKVTSAVKEFYANPAANFGFIIMFDELVADQHDYRSSEFTTDVTQRPKLTIYYQLQNSIQQKLYGTITPTKEYKIAVYNLQGKKIASHTIKNIGSLNKMLPAGVNIVKINDQKVKCVKQK